jgi:hypothetical protein
MVTARVNPETEARLGQLKTFIIDRNRLVFFDPATEERISI